MSVLPRGRTDMIKLIVASHILDKAPHNNQINTPKCMFELFNN